MSDQQKRRGHGEGTVYKVTRKKKDGSSYVFYQGQVTLPTGQRRTVSGKTKQEAIREVAQLKRDIADGKFGSEKGTFTFREYCLQWIENHGELSPKTAAGYRSIYRTHLDGIGDVKLDDLNPAMLQAHYARKREGRAPSTVRGIHRFFHVVLEEAVTHMILPRNPSNGIRGMKVPDHEMLVMREDEIPRFLEAAREHRLHALWFLAMSTGMRESELLGVRWQDIDFKQGIVRVRQEVYRVERHFICKEPKSLSSKRDLPLAEETAMALQKWRREQREEKNLAGGAWQELFEDLIFTNEMGAPLPYSHVLRKFRHIIRSVGINPEIRIHDIRHTFATILLERGVHILMVSKLLGHSSVVITLRVYGHVTLRMTEQARAEINQLVGSTQSTQPLALEQDQTLLHDILHDVMQTQ